MTDKLEANIRRGTRAKELLSDELFNEAWNSYEQQLTTAWMESLPSQEREREHIYVALAILRRVKANLHDILNTGEIAERELDWLRGQDAAKKQQR